MKNKNLFLRILVVAFVLSLVTQILIAVITLVRYSMFSGLTDYLILTLLSLIIMWVNFTIAPVLIFAVFYFIGKKPNLIFELKTILLALLIGNIVSLFISSILRSAIGIEMSVFSISILMLQFTSTLLPALFFSALAGLAIGYIRGKSLTLSAEQEPS